MFIDFPSRDFQFVLHPDKGLSDIGPWLESHNIESPIGLRVTDFMSRNRSTRDFSYFTIRCNVLYVSFGPASDLDTIDVFKKDVVEVNLLNNIMYSILKEIGYYRKGKNDKVIKYILKYFKDNVEEALNVDTGKLLNALNYRDILKEDFYEVNTNSSKEEIIRLFNFYMGLTTLVVRVFCHFNNLNCRNLGSPYTFVHSLSLAHIRPRYFNMISICSSNRIVRDGYDVKTLMATLKNHLRPDKIMDLQIAEGIKTNIVEISMRNNHV